MNLKGKLSWLIGLFCAIGISYDSPQIKNNSLEVQIKEEQIVVTKQKEPSVTIDHHINKKKHEVDLECDSVAMISTNDFTFYACEGDIDSELICRMEYIAAVKKYVKEKLGLKQTTNYRIYKNDDDEKPKTWYRLYVTPRFEIPREWRKEHYVNINETGLHECGVEGPAIFTSSVDRLVDKSVICMMKGFDVFRRNYLNFGGGCNLSPIFFQDSIVEQTDTIIHEDWHDTVEEIGYDTSIEESLATLVGAAVTINFTEYHFGKDSKEHKEAKGALEFWLEFSKYTIEQNNKLLELYGTDMPLQEKIDEKEKIIVASKYKRNNAELWEGLPYTKYFPLVYRVYEAYPDLEELVGILLKTPKEEKKAIEYLELYAVPGEDL